MRASLGVRGCLLRLQLACIVPCVTQLTPTAHVADRVHQSTIREHEALYDYPGAMRTLALCASRCALHRPRAPHRRTVAGARASDQSPVNLEISRILGMAGKRSKYSLATPSTPVASDSGPAAAPVTVAAPKTREARGTSKVNALDEDMMFNMSEYESANDG